MVSCMDGPVHTRASVIISSRLQAEGSVDEGRTENLRIHGDCILVPAWNQGSDN